MQKLERDNKINNAKTEIKTKEKSFLKIALSISKMLSLGTPLLISENMYLSYLKQ